MTFVGGGKTVTIPKDYDKDVDDLDVVAHSDFKITLSCKLTTNDNLESGSFGKMFDLYKFYDVVTDSTGLRNENPYDDDDEDDDFVPGLPSEDQTVIIKSGSGTGNVNVYNMTPAQIKLTIDNGLEKFINWYENDESVGEVNSGFWNSFGIFKNNPASELYEEYFGFLPTEFKTIILGCCTIAIVGGVFCALRKKLT